MAEAAFIRAATDAAKGLAHLMAARAFDEINLALGFKGQLGKLKEKFKLIQAFLEDARNPKYEQKSKMVIDWVNKVKDVAYLADDVLDEYAIEIFRREMELKNRFERKFRNFFTLSNPVVFRLRMAHKVNEILSLFDEIDKDAKDIGLNRVDVATTSVTNTYNSGQGLESRQYAIADASEFIGREKDKAELLEVICSPLREERKLSTVAVVGMGGMGKTTLARHLYDDEKVCAHFGKKIWICVSKNFEVTRLLNEMIESVTSTRSKLSNIDAITRKLQEELKGKKLLLVLDDVWNENESLWGVFKGLIHTTGIGPGSVILTTTRSDEVANGARPIFKPKLEGLSKEKSWSLLYHIVSNNIIQPIDSVMMEVGIRIVDKCRGVPLAIKVMGALLGSKPYLHEWKSIEKSELWDLPEGKRLIIPSLLLSFHNLPSPSIKQCFAYCSIIPKGHNAYKNELMGLWSSQGYLCNGESNNLTPEEIGEKYLQILLSSSLLESVPTPLGVEGYTMHDLVYDLALYVCGSDLVKEAKGLSEEGSCRHLVFSSGENKSITWDFPSQKALTKLRTLNLKGTAIPGNVLNHTKYLRTLFLDRTNIKEVPPGIGLLKHLRFLDVSHNPITTLPDSIGKLYQLQTLILQRCTRMVTLPKVLNMLVNLRHISTTAPMFACKGLERLINLQSLPSLSLNDDGEGWTIDELGQLHELRDEVHILGLEFIKDKKSAQKAGLSEKANVTKLKLSWVEGREETSDGISEEDVHVLEGLESHSNITSLEVLNFNSLRFPTWISKMAVLTKGSNGQRTQLNNLTKVKLLNCNKCQTLPKLGQLPLLKFLTLRGLDVEIIGSEFYGGDDLGKPAVESFKYLRELEISGFRRLTTWREPPKDGFPSLQTLQIMDCTLLESIPAFRFESLMTLELENLDSVESLDIIKYNTGLTSLIVDVLPEIKSLPQELANCRMLQTLHISGLTKLTALPRGLELLVNLKSIKVAHCDVLSFVMNGVFPIRSSLRNFEIVDCPNLRTIPGGLEDCTMLETLVILQCRLTKVWTNNISKLVRLSKLRICFRSAGHLRLVLDAAKNLPLLRRLEIDGYRDEKEMREYFSNMNLFLHLPSLAELMLRGRPNIKILPQQINLLTRITHLYIWNFDDLEEIPTWICKLSSLRYLILDDCTNLKSLPSKKDLQCLIHLNCLRITNCPSLVERYAKDGPQWHNISHITEIIIDDKTVQDVDTIALDDSSTLPG